MRKIIFVVVLLSVIGLFAEEMKIESPLGSFKLSVDDNSMQTSQGDVNIADEIASRVEKLENKYIVKLNKLDQKKALKLTDEIYQFLALLPDDLTAKITPPQKQKKSPDVSSEANSNINININMKDEDQVTEPVTETETKVISTGSAMSESEFNKLLSNVEDESFSDDQLAVVRIATKSKFFKMSQLIRLLDVFSFSEEKIDCVRLVYPKVVDKDNAHNLLGAFTYSSDKKEVEKIINQ